MLVLIQQLLHQAVLSLRTGGVIGEITGPIINPNNLRIEAFYVLDRFEHRQLILLREDIRDFITKGVVVDDYEVLAEADDLVRLKETLEINYDPIGKSVITTHRRNLGKIYDYSVEPDSMYIKKLYTTHKFIKSVVGTDSSIDRTQIVELTPRSIIVKDSELPVLAEQPAAA